MLTPILFPSPPLRNLRPVVQCRYRGEDERASVASALVDARGAFVVCRIACWPPRHSRPLCALVRVLGAQETVGNQIEAVLFHTGIYQTHKNDFSDDVIECLPT